MPDFPVVNRQLALINIQLSKHSRQHNEMGRPKLINQLTVKCQNSPLFTNVSHNLKKPLPGKMKNVSHCSVFFVLFFFLSEHVGTLAIEISINLALSVHQVFYENNMT